MCFLLYNKQSPTAVHKIVSLQIGQLVKTPFARFAHVLLATCVDLLMFVQAALR